MYGQDARPQLPGVVWRHPDTGKVIVNSPNINNVDGYYTAPHLGSLPFLNRRFLQSEPRFENGRWEVNMVGARGCPYNCSFCGAAVSANPDILIRARNPRDIVEEMDFEYLAHGVTAFRFVDDLFLGHKRFIQACAEVFAQEELGYKYVWDATGRINILNRLDDDLLDKLASNGCREIALGIESGSTRILERIDKRIEPEMIKSVVNRLTRRGINVKGYFILGLPTESRAEMDETVRLVQELWDITENNPGVFRMSAFEFRPYPGTPEWDRLMLTGKYTTKQLLDYTAVDLDGPAADRNEFNFSVGLQFGEVPLAELRSNLSYLIQQQKLRSQEIPSATEFIDVIAARGQPERWTDLQYHMSYINRFNNGPENRLRRMRMVAHDYHMGADSSYKGNEWWTGEWGSSTWASLHLERYG